MTAALHNPQTQLSVFKTWNLSYTVASGEAIATSPRVASILVSSWMEWV